jgi:hypothetical protein
MAARRRVMDNAIQVVGGRRGTDVLLLTETVHVRRAEEVIQGSL